MTSKLMDLILLSSRLGNDPYLVQGAGGNTSLKDNSILWVKASGKRLADAEKEPIFIAMDQASILQTIANDTEQDLCGCMIDSITNFKPSIETSIHAVMPHKVVLHVHSIRAISWACKTNISELTERLNGLSWAFIPYERPGIQLTKAIVQKTQGTLPDILILGNHGLIVAAEDCYSAEMLLKEVEFRLDNQERASSVYDLQLLEDTVSNTPYRLPRYLEAHELAINDLSFQIATYGSLYPDHVVFLGQGVRGIKSKTELIEILQSDNLPLLILFKSIGALVLKEINNNAEDMVLALALVVKRIQKIEGLRYLTFSEEIAVLNWDAEKFRQSVSS